MKVIVAKTDTNSIKETNERIKNIAKKAELIIVVGEKKNENVNKMYHISLKECGNAMMVETIDDLYLNYIKRFKTVGVVQDTLTSQKQIETIVDILEHTQVEGYIHEHFK